MSTTSGVRRPLLDSRGHAEGTRRPVTEQAQNRRLAMNVPASENGRTRPPPAIRQYLERADDRLDLRGTGVCRRAARSGRRRRQTKPRPLQMAAGKRHNPPVCARIHRNPRLSPGI